MREQTQLLKSVLNTFHTEHALIWFKYFAAHWGSNHWSLVTLGHQKPWAIVVW